jgi:hypothetical protein
MFGPKRDEIIGGWGKLRNEELHNLHSPNTVTMSQVKKDGMDRTCSMREEYVHGFGTKYLKETTRKIYT